MKGEVERVVSCPTCKQGVKWDPYKRKISALLLEEMQSHRLGDMG